MEYKLIVITIYFISSVCSDNLKGVNVTYCQDTLMLNASADGVCYNGSDPYGIFNETLAAANGLKKVLWSLTFFCEYILFLE